MKNVYLLCITICIVVSSCKKDSTQKLISPEVNTKLHAVSFTVPGFESTTQGLATHSVGESALLKDQIKYLHFVIYKVDKDTRDSLDPHFEYNPEFERDPVRDIIQKSTDANFGTFKDSLTEGKYWFFIVGDQLAGKIYKERTHGTGGTYWTSPSYHLDNALLTSGIYFAGFDTTISAPISKAVTLKRMVSKVTIRITDVIPDNGAKFILNLEDYPPAFDLFNGRGKFHSGRDDPFETVHFSYDIPNSQIGKSNFEFSTIVFPYHSYSSMKITLDCVDKMGNVIDHKAMPSQGDDAIRIESNTNYIYSGSFFTQAAQFAVTVDNKWNAPVNIPFTVSYSKPSKTRK
ncbi:MAG: hypothetical protein JWP67_2761 [Mucilaginibacter sp.]|nr:hypothetical protein [Mucilaginibacter sp.]